MLKKIICWFLLFTFCNYMIGCYTEEEISKKKILPNAHITEVVLPSGESIYFNRDGGRLITENNIVVGKGLNDSLKKVYLDGIKEIQTRLYPTELNKLKGKKIFEIITKNYYPIIFEDEGGNYDEKKGTITGSDVNLNKISVNIEWVLNAYTSKPDTVSMERLKADSTIRVKQLVFTNGTTITFGEKGGRYKKVVNYITGKTLDGDIVKINLDNILYVRIKKIDAAETTFAVLGGIVGVGLIVALVALASKSAFQPSPGSSCPFVYSYDGEKYVFDAEPFGGAITKGLERQDYSRLENLKEVSGKYKLKVTNEVNETQFVNGMSLLVVDHPSNTEAVVNNNGKIYITKNVQNILSATDENGKDISKFIEKEDGIMWETKMPVHFNNLKGKTRDHLTFAFKKPSGVDSVDLIINAGTTFWGSNMIREMLALYGNELDNWYREIDRHGNEYKLLMNFSQREELYGLKLYLKEKNGWVEKYLIKGGGPFISERRVIPLNIGNVEGDTLFLKVDPPLGFWSFDYLALESNEHFNSTATEVKASVAKDFLGNNITKIISQKDDKYYSIPKPGNYFDIEFDAPAQREGLKRTVFLKSSGYYKIHLPETGQPNLQKLYEIATKPGSIVEYSIEKFIEWNNQYASQF